MIESLTQQHWILIGFLFFGIIAYMAWIRWKDQRWIEKRFDRRDIRTLSFGVTCFGRSSDPGKVKGSSGVLILLADRLFFRSRNGKSEIDIPADRMKKVYHDTQHRGENIRQSLIMIDYLNEKRRIETIAFKVPYPPQWIEAIHYNYKVKRK